MAIEIEIHPIQAEIINILIFKPEARFSELNRDKWPTDQFTFHLKKLVSDRVVEKVGDRYKLTSFGKEFANRFDTQKFTLERQAKLSVLVMCIRKRMKITEHLVQERLKHPYYGYLGRITGKMGWGESVYESGARELKEETSLTGRLRLIGIEHKLDYDKSGQLLEEKYFYILKCMNPKGNLIENFEGGRNRWVKEKELSKIPKQFVNFQNVMDIYHSKHFIFTEDKFVVEGY